MTCIIQSLEAANTESEWKLSFLFLKHTTAVFVKGKNALHSG